MTCPRCSASNPDSNKFCGQCGSVLDPHLTPVLEYLRSNLRDEVQSAVNARLQDQKVVEIEITERVVERLKQLGKIVGIPLGLLAILLSAWGIHSMSDVDGKIKNATDDAVTGIRKRADDATDNIVAELNAKVAKETDEIVKRAGTNAKATVESAAQATTKDLAKQAKSAQEEFDRLRSQEEAIRTDAAALSRDMNRIKPQIAAFNERLGSVEGTVAGLLKAVKCETDENMPVETIVECHTNYPNGCSALGAHDAYLNSLKNSTPRSDSVPSSFLSLADLVALDKRVPSTLTRNNHEGNKAILASLGEGRIVAAIGYLYRATLAGAESANCQLTGENNADFMLSVGFDSASAASLASGKLLSGSDRRALARTSIVAEVTPYYRSNFHPDWTINKFAAILGRQVKVIGQLMMDSDHFVPSQDCSLPSANQSTCWRASAWELHPVTQLYVCTSDRPCSEEDSHWVRLEQMP